MGKLGFSDARHLVARTGLGTEWGTIQRYQNISRHKAIHHLLMNRDMRLAHPSKMSSWNKMQNLRGNMRRKMMVMRISKVEG